MVYVRYVYTYYLCMVYKSTYNWGGTISHHQQQITKLGLQKNHLLVSPFGPNRSLQRPPRPPQFHKIGLCVAARCIAAALSLPDSTRFS